jgi:hypothetical protein
MAWLFSKVLFMGLLGGLEFAVLGGEAEAGAFSGEYQVEVNAIHPEFFRGLTDARESDDFFFFYFRPSFFRCFV